MRFARYQIEQTEGLAIETGRAARGPMETDRGYPGDLDVLVRKGPPALDEAAKALGAGHPIDLARISRLPPLRAPEKVICVGLNYREHSAESGFKQPDYPTLFSRFNSSLIGDGAERFNQRHGVRRRYAHCDYYSSEAITLRSGDVIVTRTPSGVGLSRKPLFMKAGDTVEVEIERIGILANPIVNET